MKSEKEIDIGAAIVLAAIVLVAAVGLACMTLERITETREAIKAGLVQDASGRWVKP